MLEFRHCIPDRIDNVALRPGVLACDCFDCLARLRQAIDAGRVGAHDTDGFKSGDVVSLVRIKQLLVVLLAAGVSRGERSP